MEAISGDHGVECLEVIRLGHLEALVSHQTDRIKLRMPISARFLSINTLRSICVLRPEVEACRLQPAFRLDSDF